MKTIGQISELFNIPISTLRYYDKEGLFPNIQRKSGIRSFTNTEVEALHVIECLKKSGMEIKAIKQFMAWCVEGSDTYEKRRALFSNQEKLVKDEIERLERTLAMIQFKKWYYEQAIEAGNEEVLIAMLPDALPKEIQVLFDKGHSL